MDSSPTTKFPTTADTTSYPGGYDWNNPDNIKAEDGNFSVAGTVASSSTSYHIRGYDFGFDLPNDAIIDGIIISIKGFYDRGGGIGGSFDQGNVSLGSGNSIILPLDVSAWTSAGSSTDIWGLTNPTGAYIKSSSFRIDYQVVMSGDRFHTMHANIDAVKIQVYWHENPFVPRISIIS